MRFKDSNGISISQETITVDRNVHAPFIDFNEEEADIIVLAYQPGVGKTYTILKYMIDNPSSFYFTDRHRVINDNIKGWKDKEIEYSHWEGFERKCSNQNLKDIVKHFHLLPSIACSHCRSRCTYRGQFSQRNRVFAPFEYLPTSYVMNDLPDIIFLDESKVNINKVRFNQDDTLSWLQRISLYSDMPVLYSDMMSNQNYWFFIYGGFNDLYQYHREAQNRAFEANELDDVANIGRINPYSLTMYFNFAETYNDFNRDMYNIPLWYNAFEVVNKGRKVVYLDATFDKFWFQYMLECYNGEVGFQREITVKIYKTDIVNHNTVVYNMRHGERGSWIPKESVRGYVMYWFPQHLKRIKEIYGEDNVGLISFKEVFEPKNHRYLELHDNPYFGNLRSSNLFENKRVLVILGTYFGTETHVHTHLKDIFDLDDISQIFEEEETRREYESAGWDYLLRPSNPNSLYNTILRPKRRRRFTDAHPVAYMGDGDNNNYDNLVIPVTWIQDGIWDSEIYQAFHRNRGLQNNRIIFAYCWFPPEILKEFKIESVNRNSRDEEEFWKRLEEEERQNRLIDGFIDDVNQSDRPNLMKTYLSETYRIYGKENRDDIEDFIQCYLDIKSKIKEPKK
jgi:hypothetical protein